MVQLDTVDVIYMVILVGTNHAVITFKFSEAHLVSIDFTIIK